MANSLLGVNVGGICDWDKSLIFIDAMKTARAFGSAETPWDGKPSPLAANGWPTGNFGSCVISNGHKGLYRFSCTGKCTNIVGRGSNASMTNNVYNANNNTTTADVTLNADGDLYLGFYGSNLSNIKLLRPGYTTDAAIFSDEFLKLIAPFGSLRFMDYFQTNFSTISKWAARTQVNDPTYTIKGGPYEHAITLGNLTGKGIWLHVPHQADTDFITQLAALVKAKKKAAVPCYIEYSNEVWNYSFSQAKYNLLAAQIWAKDKTDLQAFLKKQLCNDDNGYRWSLYADKTVQIAKAFQSAGVENTRAILAGQIAWTKGMDVGLQYIEKYHGEPKKYIYGIAGAPYFGNNAELLQRPDLKVDDLFGDYKITWDAGKTWSTGTNFLLNVAQNTKASNAKMTEQRDLATKYGVKYICYEGGLNMGQYNIAVPVKIAAQDDPRMYQPVYENLDNWFAGGGSEFMYFTVQSGYNKNEYWGLTDDAAKLNTPKLKAATAVANKYMPTTTTDTATYYLYDCKAGKKLSEVKDGANLDLSGNNFTLVLDTTVKAASNSMVVENVSGNKPVWVTTQVEKSAPYSLLGDGKPWLVTAGTYKVTSNLVDSQGTLLKAFSITVKVIGQTPPPPTKTITKVVVYYSDGTNSTL